MNINYLELLRIFATKNGTTYKILQNITQSNIQIENTSTPPKNGASSFASGLSNIEVILQMQGFVGFSGGFTTPLLELQQQ